MKEAESIAILQEIQRAEWVAELYPHKKDQKVEEIKFLKEKLWTP